MLFSRTMDDAAYMRRALKLASRARGLTRPNPMVGAVLVKKGEILAEDYHRKAGMPHAEALVLGRAGKKAAGATLYVTLEPCCHTGKRTPPCGRAIVEAGVRRVVAAMRDPNPQVSGRGFLELERAGMTVVAGVLESEATRLNEAYVKFMTRNRPFVILKTAMTLDGKIATRSGQSKWITGERARRLVHRLRSSVDAVMTAVGTARADDPQLTARIRGGTNPRRVLIDPELRTPPGARIFKTPPETILVTSRRGEETEKLAKSGINLIFFNKQLELDWLMERLAAMGIMSLLIEGGSSLNAHALNEGIVDKVIFFVAPKIIGGKDSYPAVGGNESRSLEEALMIRDMKTRRVGEDIVIEGYVAKG
jgi:diaminohydroxyphosphoribosylaminopyrimidine deaminase/5-amino-6-(5-phosphoribosylamino)uracil reductase